ncbi:hypothetical protein [Paenibacillus sp. FSL H7-0331]|uniref:hypothetical protein n=1 Tax=Paenibacillus sp. FSL H7-0331 TaxID=1920421 RepID=UPI00117FD9B0|nr:hypothetical protein [Paenibacillus sp. FSL H7-0331]
MRIINTRPEGNYYPFDLEEYDHAAYPSPNLPLSAKRIYSELILTHFELLIDVYNALKSHDYVALKYFEYSWTWLEIQVDSDYLVLSELKYEIMSLKNMICTDKFLLKDATCDSFSNVRIHKNDLIHEIRNKTIDFIIEIQGLNNDILSSIYFTQLMNFYNKSK